MKKNFSYDILANAKDSLEHAISHITEDGDNPSKWKIAIREVSHVIELLLKERLQREHPAFIWVRVEDLNNDEARTVTLDEAQIRLERVCNVRLPDTAVKTLAACKKLRNKIEHHQFELDSAAAKAIVGRLLSFILNFTSKSLKVDWETELKNDGAWETLVDIKEFWDDHRIVVNTRLKEAKIHIGDCSNCGADTLNLQTRECGLCHHREERKACVLCGTLTWESDLSDNIFDIPRNRKGICVDCLETIRENGDDDIPDDDSPRDEYWGY